MQAIKQMLMLKIFICSYSPMHKLGVDNLSSIFDAVLPSQSMITENYHLNFI